jgi:hypothetical protein
MIFCALVDSVFPVDVAVTTRFHRRSMRATCCRASRQCDRNPPALQRVEGAGENAPDEEPPPCHSNNPPGFVVAPVEKISAAVFKDYERSLIGVPRIDDGASNRGRSTRWPEARRRSHANALSAYFSQRFKLTAPEPCSCAALPPRDHRSPSRPRVHPGPFTSRLGCFCAEFAADVDPRFTFSAAQRTAFAHTTAPSDDGRFG